MPNDLYKSMTLLRELDEKVNLLFSEANKHVELGNIDTKFLEEHYKKITSLSDEKIQISVQCYNEIDKMIKVIDENLVRFAHERDGTSLEHSSPATSRKKKRHTPNVPAPNIYGPERIMIGMDQPLDPNEPLYCFCKKVSYGQMVCCDSSDCEIEWYHFGCVGLTQEPTGQWFCPNCNARKKK